MTHETAHETAHAMLHMRGYDQCNKVAKYLEKNQYALQNRADTIDKTVDLHHSLREIK